MVNCHALGCVVPAFHTIDSNVVGDVPVTRLALAAGVALKVVTDRFGHSTIGITADLYTHVVPAVARDAAEAIAAVLRAAPQQFDANGWRNVGAPDPNDPLNEPNKKGA